MIELIRELAAAAAEELRRRRRERALDRAERDLARIREIQDIITSDIERARRAVHR